LHIVVSKEGRVIPPFLLAGFETHVALAYTAPCLRIEPMHLLPIVLGLVLALGLPGASHAQIYRCEDGNGVIEYSNKPSGGKDRNCKSVELPTVTTIPAPKLPIKSGGGGNSNANTNSNANLGPSAGTKPNGSGSNRIDDSTQRSRDGDRKRILEDELRKEEVKLTELRREYNNGEPERLGDERNYQKYLDRVQRMKDEIGRSEGNVGSLKKELGSVK
jgi:Domain of unknown function (DUF4124)